MIRVGGASEVEVKERKDRVEDAMHATRAAVEEGILPGGGVPLLRAAKALSRAKSENDDQRAGIEIVRKALPWPARQIVINSGEDGSVVVGKILDNNSYTYGFDAQTGEYGDLVGKGIIDPTKVVALRCKMRHPLRACSSRQRRWSPRNPRRRRPCLPCRRAAEWTIRHHATTKEDPGECSRVLFLRQR